MTLLLSIGLAVLTIIGVVVVTVFISFLSVLIEERNETIFHAIGPVLVFLLLVCTFYFWLN